MESLTVRRYYWHVKAWQASAPYASAYGPTAYFDVVPPPLPRSCSIEAATALGEADLFPYLQKLMPDFYTDESLENWRVAGPVCPET